MRGKTRGDLGLGIGNWGLDPNSPRRKAGDWLRNHSPFSRTRFLVLFAAAILALSLAGCQGATWPRHVAAHVPTAPDVSATRQRRQEGVLRGFEQRRQQAQYQAALSRWQQQDTEECRRLLADLIERQPEHLEATLLMAELEASLGEHEAALAKVRRLVENRPADARGHYTLAMLLDGAGQSAEAVAHFQRASQLNPDNEIYRLSYHAAAGIPPDDASDPAPCAPGGSCAVSRAGYAGLPGHSSRRAREGGEQAHQADSPSIPPATPALLPERLRAVSDDPQNPRHWIDAAVASLQSNQPEAAIRLLERAQGQCGESAAFYRVLGTAYYRAGDFQSSQVALTKALSLDNSSPLAYFLMGCTMRRLGNQTEAERHFQLARRLDPRFAAQP